MKDKPMMTFREGAVGLSVWERTGKAGTYFDFTVSRCYQAADGTFGYSSSFHESNAEALTQVVSQAAAWIEQHRREAGIENMPREGQGSNGVQEAYE